jgi:hypothetical protein
MPQPCGFLKPLYAIKIVCQFGANSTLMKNPEFKAAQKDLKGEARAQMEFWSIGS